MKILAILLLIISFAGLTFADVSVPPVAQEIKVESTQSYPDYQFYLCSYKIAVKPNPNPPHPSRPDMIVTVSESFAQKPIELPFTQPITSFVHHRGNKLSEKVYWLVAIKKSQVQELEPKIRSAVLGSTAIEGIKLHRLEDSLELRGKGNQGAAIVVNKISLDEKEMTLKAEEDVSGSVGSLVGLGLLLTGLVLIGGLWIRRKFFLGEGL